MGFFDFLNNNKNGDIKDVVDLTEERNGIKETIKANFKDKLGFTDLEIKEVLDVVAMAEMELDEIKMNLANVNLNNPNTETDVENATIKIQEVAKRMGEDVKSKAKEIMQRRKDMEEMKKTGY